MNYNSSVTWYNLSMHFKQTYLDNLTYAPMPPEVIEIISEYYSEHIGLAGSFHQWGQWNKSAMAHFIESIEEPLGCAGIDCAFALGIKLPKISDGRILISPFEQPYTMRAIAESERDFTKIPMSDWIVDVEWVKKQLENKEIGLVVISVADRVTGTVQPIERIAAICDEFDVPLFVDFSTIIGRRKFSVQEYGIRYGYICGRSFGAPCDLIIGTKHDLTFPLPLAAGFSKAVLLLYDNIDETMSYLEELTKYFRDTIQLHLPHLIFHGGENKIPGVLAISFEDVPRESMILALDMQGVAIWAGDSLAKPIESLIASGVPENIAESTLIFAFWHTNNQEEIDYVLRVLPPIVDRIRFETGSPKFNA